MGVCLSRHHRIRRSSDTTMANTIKMTNPIKNIVSKRRRRYTKDGFNLDLAYITERLIAMGFPADRLEGVYRNHIDDVFKFLEKKHPNNYWIYNLCKERSYDPSKFQTRVSTFPFDDHNPPKIEQIQPFCEAVDQWLSADSKNVAAVHCKAGKGRTGTMVCCYLLHSGHFKTADEALSFYGQKRAHDKKGVTIPSQRRYVHYYSALLTRRLHYRTNTIQIRALTLRPAPLLNGQCSLELVVTQADSSQKMICGSHELRKGDAEATISLDACAPLAGDVKVELFHKPKVMRKDKLFHFWFNTFFVAQEVGAARAEPLDDSSDMPTYKMCLDKWHLDDAHKDKQHKIFPSDFKVELLVQQIPATCAWSRRAQEAAAAAAPATPAAASPAASPAASTYSDSSPDESADETWDSGESTYL